MAEENTITLNPLKHDKLGILHCGVITEGRISVAGKVSNIEDGEEKNFDHVNITVKRNGSDYTFTKH